MKKLLLSLMALLIALSLVGCSNKTNEENNGSNQETNEPAQPPVEENTGSENGNENAGSEVAVDEELKAVVDTILKDVPNLPMNQVMPLDETNFEMFAFTKWVDGMSAVQADSLIGSIAHSVVLVKVPEGSDVATIASDIEKNANPRKWVCVEAEKTVVATKGNLILLVMSNAEATDAIVANFNK